MISQVMSQLRPVIGVLIDRVQALNQLATQEKPVIKAAGVKAIGHKKKN